MPAVSRSQQALFAIAEHSPEKLHKENKGLAKLPKKTLHDFASGSEKGKPAHVAHHSPPESYPTPILKGMSKDIQHENMKSLKGAGMSELDATKKAIRAAKGYSNVHKRLGPFLHSRKDGKPHGSPKD